MKQLYFSGPQRCQARDPHPSLPALPAKSGQNARLKGTNPREILFAHAQWASRAVLCINPLRWAQELPFLSQIESDTVVLVT